MQKKATVLCIIFAILLTAGSVSALRYEWPFAPVDGGRAAQNMPEPFSVEATAGHRLIAGDDFNDNAGGSDTLTLETTLQAGEKFFSGGAITLVKNQTDSAMSFVMRYGGDVLEGGYYAFRCRIKTEGLSGGSPKNILQAHNSSNGWLKEAGRYGMHKSVSGTSEWYDMTQLLQLPAGTAGLDLCGYLPKDALGTVCFDDFELYHVAADPLETVLKRPNYKGLIYGDGKADVNLDVLIEEREGFFSYTDMALSVRLTDAEGVVYRQAEADTLSCRLNFVFSSAGLPAGDYYLQTILNDKNSNAVISKKEQTIRKRDAAWRPEIYLDKNGRIVHNASGEKTLLKRMYNSGGDYLEVAQNANACGVGSIGHYGLWWAVDTQQEALNYMRENGGKAHINLGDFRYSARTWEESKRLIREQSDVLPFYYQVAGDYKDDPVLDGYYLFDEPDPITEGEELRWSNEILAQADVNHPTYGAADAYWDRYGLYTKMTDILLIDPYPVTGADSDDIGKIGRSVKQIKENFPNRPVCIVLQGFHWTERGDARGPNREELLNMAWQAICEGSEGLDWYAYSAMKKDDVKDMDEWLADLEAVYRSVMSYEKVILSDEPAPLYQVTNGGPWLNITLRRYGGKTYLFAVNNTRQAQNTAVDINGAGRHELQFAPLEVIIREIVQKEFLSPEAELEGMGFSNGNRVFAVSEGEESVLYVPEDSGVINYCADISDNARLYIGSREMPLSGKITVRLADSVTVRVIAEDGITETTKKYRVVKSKSANG